MKRYRLLGPRGDWPIHREMKASKRDHDTLHCSERILSQIRERDVYVGWWIMRIDDFIGTLCDGTDGTRE